MGTPTGRSADEVEQDLVKQNGVNHDKIKQDESNLHWVRPSELGCTLKPGQALEGCSLGILEGENLHLSAKGVARWETNPRSLGSNNRPSTPIPLPHSVTRNGHHEWVRENFKNLPDFDPDWALKMDVLKVLEF